MKTNLYWGEALVVAVRDLTPTVREITLKPEEGACEPYEAGSHLPVQPTVHGESQLRSYSLVGPPDAGGYRIAVKRLDEGRGGSLAMWQLRAGERLRIGSPQNHFPLDFGAAQVLLVAGGIGVTPLVYMAQLLASRGTKVRMLYAARSESELAYLGDLEASLQDALHVAVGERIDFAREIAPLPAGAQVYVCGPQGMLDAARHAWEAAGRAPVDLRFETFGSSGKFTPQAFRVQVPRHSLDITVPADCSLLDALERAGVQTLSDCKRGECGLCAVDVVSVDGEVDHRDVYLSEAEKRGNRRICACVSRVVGTITLDSAWRAD